MPVAIGWTACAADRLWSEVLAFLLHFFANLFFNHVQSTNESLRGLCQCAVATFRLVELSSGMRPANHFENRLVVGQFEPVVVVVPALLGHTSLRGISVSIASSMGHVIANSLFSPLV